MAIQDVKELLVPQGQHLADRGDRPRKWASSPKATIWLVGYDLERMRVDQP